MSTITDTIFMVRPANFGFNPETAGSNAFQDNSGDLSKDEISALARKEFDDFVEKLKESAINVIVYEDTATPVKTDAVYPNNWVTTHENILITYPMFSPNRRLERNLDIIEDLKTNFGYKKQYFFEHYESEDKFLEGTGSMILDRVNKIVYACLSERTNVEILEKFSILMRYQKLFFHSYDADGKPIYHTNVMMALAENFCVICMDSIIDEKERKEVKRTLEESGKEIIEITQEQLAQFAGNMIQLKNNEEVRFLVMSEQAYRSLEYNQIERIEKHCKILHSSLDTIEKYGGGSARCMIAEIFH